MATPTITPAAPAASAPAAAPSTPAPAAPASTTPSTPAAPATTTPVSTPAEPQSIEQRLAGAWQKAKEKVAADNPDEPEAPAAAAPAEPAAQPAAEPAKEPEPGAEPTPEAKTEPAAPADEFQLNLDDTGDASDPAKLTEFLKGHPDAQAALDANPELKNMVYGAMRRDGENREIREYFPTVEAAKTAYGAAASFQAIDNHFLQATTPEGAKSFLDHWVQEAMYVDDKGAPVMENGKYKLHPALPYILDHIGTNRINYLANDVKTTGQIPAAFAPVVDGLSAFANLKGDERLQAVVEVLREQMSPSSPAPEALTPELQAKADELKRREDALQAEKDAGDRRSREAQQQAHFASIDRAEDAAATSVVNQLKPRLAASGLSDFEQQAALNTIGNAIDQALGHKDESGNWTNGSHASSRMFQSAYDSILQQYQPGQAREAALKKHILSYVNSIIGKISADTMRKAKAGTINRQTETQTKVTEQQRTSAADPRATSIGVTSQKKMSPKELRESIITEYKKSHNGEDPEMNYVMAEAAKRMNSFGAPAR